MNHLVELWPNVQIMKTGEKIMIGLGPRVGMPLWICCTAPFKHLDKVVDFLVEEYSKKDVDRIISYSLKEMWGPAILNWNEEGVIE